MMFTHWKHFDVFYHNHFIVIFVEYCTVQCLWKMINKHWMEKERKQKPKKWGKQINSSTNITFRDTSVHTSLINDFEYGAQVLEIFFPYLFSFTQLKSINHGSWTQSAKQCWYRNWQQLLRQLGIRSDLFHCAVISDKTIFIYNYFGFKEKVTLNSTLKPLTNGNTICAKVRSRQINTEFK